MKIKTIPLILIIVVIVIGVLGYYSYPISIKSAFESYKNIEKIDIDIISKGEVTRYILQFDQDTNVNDLINILNSTSYTHEYRGKFKGTFSRIMKMSAFYRNADNKLDNFSMEITEDGEVIINNKLYQMNRKEAEIFNDLYDWILNKGDYINS